MRLITFLQWWWSKNDWFNRTAIPFVTIWVPICLLSTIFLGPKALIFILIGFFTVAAGWAIFGIYYWLHNLWKQFNIEQPTDDVRIVRKLKGIPATTEVWED